jgi:hypothetical protein
MVDDRSHPDELAQTGPSLCMAAKESLSIIQGERCEEVVHNNKYLEI